MLSHIKLFGIPWTVALQAPLSVEFPRQEYWSGLPFLPPKELSEPGIETVSPASPSWTGKFFIDWATEEAHLLVVDFRDEKNASRAEKLPCFNLKGNQCP